MTATRQLKIHLQDDEFELLARFAEVAQVPRSTAARALLVSVLRDDAAANADADERPPRDVRGDMEGTTA